MNNNIETIATGFVTQTLAKANRLKPFINAGEKEPAWDGNIYIHTDNRQTKKNLKKVTTQIKGKGVDLWGSSTIKYPIEIDQLNNYLHNGGVFYFVVYIDKATYEPKQIYHNALTPMKIRYIKSSSTAKKYINVEFSKFPNDPIEMERLFQDYYRESKKQNSFAESEQISIEDLASMGILEGLTFTISGRGISSHTVPKIMEGKDLYVYAKTKGNPIPIPVDFIPNVSAVETVLEMHLPVFVKSKKYYDDYLVINHNAGSDIKLGKSMLIHNFSNTKKGVPNIEIQLAGKLNERIQDIEFITDCLTYQEIIIGGIALPLHMNMAEADDFIQRSKRLRDWLLQLRKVLNILNVDKEMDIDNLTNKDSQNIALLITALIDKTPIALLEENIPIIARMKIANILLLLIFEKYPSMDNKYTIKDFFTEKLSVTAMDSEGHYHRISQYAILKKTDFIEFDNTNFKNILNDIIEVAVDHSTVNNINNLLLEMLMGYDNTKSKDLYMTVCDMAEWLSQLDDEYLPYPIRMLNLMQTKKREAKLTYSDRQILNKINTDYATTENDLFSIGALLLLEEYEEVDRKLAQLSEEDRNTFESLPIYALRNQ
jgi:hypothetical protein